ncbi:hypothetical protein ERJ75_000017800 [Trypanosoma vivax]|uniref:Uncharacterized protein n=1 Tax=Trypanosoma vivax (strain Y486) TaxID=1055687 RepID=G0U442_TRYVY|nr:hypothetical protein TRVL_00664 [Trypanosoma vivax]KAH8611623.1 hypothetical protein ERJ75_000933100 [Trypanosoma vivax]KAH8620877.1 hypothetical protein ERJ75_000017800 [Trypanosoma vivax]CCC52204.1 conserved hypothetical protein [Trypanosoma vivax Y486]
MEALELKLDALQGKLERMHTDIKKLGTAHPVISGSAPVAQDPESSASIPPISIGRGARLNATRSTEKASCDSPSSVLPPIASPQHSQGSAGQTATGHKRVVLPAAKFTESADVPNNRRKCQAAKQKLQDFVKPMLLPPEATSVQELANAPCAWLLSIGLACSYVSGERITIEDILRQNRLAMHYVSFPSVTLAELFDVTNEFLANHAKMREIKAHCEVATFDTETMDEACDGVGMEEQVPIRTLSQFRKELSQSDENSICIVNFDPYLIEQHEIRMRINYTESSDIESIQDAIKPRWSAKNQGTFALIIDFRPALHTVALGVPILLEDGRIVIEEHVVPLQTLYNALCVKDAYCNRARGFVRVFIDQHHPEKVPSIFPLGMLDGSLSGGLLMTSLDTSIAPHILGLSLMHHLVACTLLEDDASKSGKSAKASSERRSLTGIPVTELCRVLNLDIATIVGSSSRASVGRAFSWYRVFLSKLHLLNTVAVGVVLVNRRGDAVDGPVNIQDDVFMSHLELAVKTRSVMLIGFNVNIALNVLVDNRSEPCHFAIVIGLDVEQGIVRLADVNVKKYRKTWHVPLTRLHSAVIGYGYIMVAKSQATIDQLNAKQYEDSILKDASYALPPTKRLLRFEYPKKNYAVTILAEAFATLGFNANVESVANLSGFHISFMLSRHLPLESAASVARNYSNHHLDDRASVYTTHMDKDAPHSNPQTLLNQIRSALTAPKDRCLIVNFDTAVIQANKEVWNGSDGGTFAIVLSYDDENSLVTLTDVNHEAFYRTWVCPLNVLFDAVSAVDSIALRARGTLLITNESQHDNYVGSYGYDMCHALVHHPFKPSVWPAFRCLALVASEMCHNGASGTAHCGGQYSSEDFLYTISSFSVPKAILVSKLDSKQMVDFANVAFERLRIPLETVVVDLAAAGTFFEACRDEVMDGKQATVTLLGYDTHPIHGIPGYSVGVVNRVRGGIEGGSVQVVDGNGCTLGSVWERSADELKKAVTAMVRIRCRAI